MREKEVLVDERVAGHTLDLQCMLDASGAFVFISDVVTRILSYEADELLGTPASRLFQPSDALKFNEALKTLAPGNTFTLPFVKLYTKTAELKLAEVNVTCVSGALGTNGFLVYLRNLSVPSETYRFKQQIVSSHAEFFSKHPFGIVHMDANGRIDRINKKLTDDLGYSLEDVQAQNVMSFLLPQYRRKAFLMYYNASHLHEPETYDVEVYRAMGQPLHINLTIVPVVHHSSTVELYVVVKDISDRIELREALRRNSIVADKSHNGIVIMNNTMQIEWVNDAFTRMNGYTLEESIGKDPADLLNVAVQMPALFGDRIAILSTGASIFKEFLCYKKDHTPYWNQVEITPVLNKNGKLERIISTHTDITERKKAGEDLNSLANDLYKQNKELQQFAYIVSHNLRAPVASIIGLADLIDLYKDDDETRDAGIKELRKAAGNLDGVIKDLSSILEATNGNGGIVKEMVNVKELVDQVLVDLNAMIADTGASVMMHNYEVNIFTSKAYLYSIIYNLVGNALKYRSQKPPKINIDFQSKGKLLEFTVQDNGIGIDLQRHKDALFKPYHRFAPHVQGKGLGLFLVKSHIESLGGTIAISSQVGEGTTFQCTIPV